MVTFLSSSEARGGEPGCPVTLPTIHPALVVKRTGDSPGVHVYVSNKIFTIT